MSTPLWLILCLWCLLLGSFSGGWVVEHDGPEVHAKNMRRSLAWALVATLAFGLAEVIIRFGH